MSLTLFPITALLLLLSGVGSPVHATGYRETIAALRKQFLGSAVTPLPSTAARGQLCSSRFAWRSGCALAIGRELRVSAQQRRAPRPVRRWERKQYRTRFGFAEGAYLAAGPPLRDGLSIVD